MTSTEVKALWLEKNISEQLTSGNGALIPVAADGPTGYFLSEELGLGWDQHPSIVTVASTLRADNQGRREAHQREHERLVKAFQAEAKKQGLRANVEPYHAPTGCTGCPSCVPGTRSKPRRSLDPARRRNAGDVERRRIPVTAHQETQEQRPRRSGDARRRLNQRRRAEQELVRNVVRRSGVVIQKPSADEN